MKKIILLLCLSWITTGLAQAQTRLGLHFTAEEVTIWRDRWANGPFKTANDATPFPNSVSGVNGGNGLKNTPSDKNRILNNANSFRTNPSSDYYSNVYKGTGEVPADDGSQSPNNAGEKMRDAGFVWLMTGDTTYARVIRQELLKTIADPLLDFSNRTRWKLGSTMGEISPSFIIGEYLVRLTYALEYITAPGHVYGNLTTANKNAIDAWLYNAAVWLESMYNLNINNYFTDRNKLASGPYTMQGWIASLEKNVADHSFMYKKADGTDGYKAGKVSRTWGNKYVTQASSVGMIGIHLGNQSLQVSAKKFVKDLYMYAIWPDGSYLDFNRVSTDNHEKGFSYAGLDMLYAFADAGARIGDTELYDYTTTGGTTTATSGPDATSDGTTAKGLKMFTTRMLDMRTKKVGTPQYYGTKVTGNAGNAAYRLDGVNAASNNYSIADLAYASASNYYFHKDGTTYFRDCYQRTAPGAVPLTATPQTAGTVSPYTFGGHISAGYLMKSGMEVLVNPYPTLQGGTVKTNQTISFGNLPVKIYGDAPFSITVSASSGLAVTLTSLNTSVATVSGTTITIVGAGTATIRASQAGNSTYNAAGNTDQVLTVNKKTQTLTFGTLADLQTSGGPITLSATATSGLTPAFRIVSGPATIAGTSLTLTGVIGTVVVEASQPGNANYTAAGIITRPFNVIAIPVVTITDLIPAASFSDRDTVVTVDGGRHMKYIRTYTLASSYTIASKLSIESGSGDDGNGLENVTVRILAGSTWVTLPVTAATRRAFIDRDLSYSGTAFTKVELSTIGANIKNRLNKIEFKGKP